MFSGIIEAQGAIVSTKAAGKCKRVRIQKPRTWKLALGESVSVDGICSTVAAKGAGYFDVEYMPVTLSKTTASAFEKGCVVNLERSLRYGDRVHGHFMAGHIDTTSTVVQVVKNGRSRIVSIKTLPELYMYIVPRGSIAVNGVSLTVAEKGRGFFSVALIPHTLTKTNLAALKRGDAVNIEADMLARYGASGRVATHAKKKIGR